MSEEWRKIPGFDGYEVSSLGNVRSWVPPGRTKAKQEKPHNLKFRKNKDGYRTTDLRKDGKNHNKKIAQLVALAWYGPRPEGMVVRHLDGSRDNDVPENLRWGTWKENALDRKTHGTQINGSRVYTSKLTEDQVREILSSSERVTAIARKFGVGTPMISGIKKGRYWRHVSI